MSRGLRPPATSFFHLASVSRDSKRSRSEEHTSELQSPDHLVCRLLLEKKKKTLNSNRHCMSILVFGMKKQSIMYSAIQVAWHLPATTADHHHVDLCSLARVSRQCLRYV